MLKIKYHKTSYSHVNKTEYDQVQASLWAEISTFITIVVQLYTSQIATIFQSFEPSG